VLCRAVDTVGTLDVGTRERAAKKKPGAKAGLWLGMRRND
jgi:hypothetical protein